MIDDMGDDVVYDSDCFCGDSRCGSMIRIKKLSSVEEYIIEMKLRNNSVTSIVLSSEEMVKMAKKILKREN